MHEPEYAKVEISQLQLDPSNARLHPEKNLAAIKGSLAKFGQQRPILVDRRNVVIAGNGTLAAARSLGWTTIDVKYTDLSGPEAIAYALADNRSAELAMWDKDILGDQLQMLYEDGFGIADIGFDLGDWGINENPDNPNNNQDDDFYTKKIKSPIYEPKGEKPSETELIDNVKVASLMNEITSTPDLDPIISAFLIQAAQRHLVFNYEKIAEYYAHAPKHIQLLMEKSALVIIDFEKAIENGFVTLTKELAQAYAEDSGNDDTE